MKQQRLVVIGGGAAGFFCAINAARMNPELEVIIIEKSNKVLGKVKVSGGGRCNVTHSCFELREMVSKYPRGENFVKKAFHRFFTTDTIEWFCLRGVDLKTEADGRMFPVTDSSQTIIDCLLREVNLYSVKIWMNKEVKTLKKEDDGFHLQFANSEKIISDFVCIASGGYPKSSMFNWLKETGHTIEDPVPSLFTFNLPDNSIIKLMGITLGDVRIKIAGTKLEEEGPLLITHWGLSGPVVLRLSAWGARQLAEKNWEFAILINWLPAYNEQSLKEKFQELRFDLAEQKISNKNSLGLPHRLWDHFLFQAGIKEETRWADLLAVLQNKLVKLICAGDFLVKGKTTFKEEFVTAGGIKLSEVEPQTMMSKKTPNLYFAGEILDVDGVTGGFNFQHAWTSGWIAGNTIAESSIAAVIKSL